MDRRQVLTAGLAGVAWAVSPAAPKARAQGSTGALAWTRTPAGTSRTFLDAVSSTADGTWACGRTLVDGFADTRPLIMVRRGSAWETTATPITANARLSAIAVAGPQDVWAVGSVESDEEPAVPLILRWNGTRWRRMAGPAVPAGSFDTVQVAPDGSVWVAGWARVGGGEPGVVHRYANRAWQSISRGLERTIHVNALAIHSPTDAWAALNPGLAHFDGMSWTMSPDLPADGSIILTDFAASAPGDLWAVGVDHRTQVGAAYVTHHNGRRWSARAVPENPAQLYGVALRQGRPVAVGESFEDEQASVNTPYVLALRGGSFVAAAAPAVRPTSTGVLTGVAADPRGRLWTVGAENLHALAAIST